MDGRKLQEMGSTVGLQTADLSDMKNAKKKESVIRKFHEEIISFYLILSGILGFFPGILYELYKSSFDPDPGYPCYHSLPVSQWTQIKYFLGLSPAGGFVVFRSLKNNTSQSASKVFLLAIVIMLISISLFTIGTVLYAAFEDDLYPSCMYDVCSKSRNRHLRMMQTREP